VVETPTASLVAGMKWFLGVYTRRFDLRHRFFGHLFSGRYKALVSGTGRTQATGLAWGGTAVPGQRTPREGGGGKPSPPANDHEHEVDCAAVADGQLDLRLQPTESKTT